MSRSALWTREGSSLQKEGPAEARPAGGRAGASPGAGEVCRPRAGGVCALHARAGDAHA